MLGISAIRFTALDLAMIADHPECVSYLVASHAPSGGGKYHRAALTIQAVWKFHRHKVEFVGGEASREIHSALNSARILLDVEKDLVQKSTAVATLQCMYLV